MKLSAFQEAELKFASKVGYLQTSLQSLWEQDNQRRSQKANVYGPRSLSYEAFVETFLTNFRLAFVLRKEGINYPYKELTEAELTSFWNSNRDLFTRYNGDSFEKTECLDIIAKRIREAEYVNNVKNLLL